MSRNSTLAALIETFKQSKESGTTQIDTEILISYLTHELTTGKEAFSPDELQTLIERSRLHSAESIEVFRIKDDSLFNAIKTSIIINGAAAISLLALIANIIKQEAPSRQIFSFGQDGIFQSIQQNKPTLHLHGIFEALLIYAAAIGFSSLASGFRFLLNNSHGLAMRYYGQGDSTNYDKQNVTSEKMQTYAFALAATAYTYFIFGCIQVFYALNRFTI